MGGPSKSSLPASLVRHSSLQTDTNKLRKKKAMNWDTHPTQLARETRHPKSDPVAHEFVEHIIKSNQGILIRWCAAASQYTLYAYHELRVLGLEVLDLLLCVSAQNLPTSLAPLGDVRSGLRAGARVWRILIGGALGLGLSFGFFGLCRPLGLHRALPLLSCVQEQITVRSIHTPPNVPVYTLLRFAGSAEATDELPTPNVVRSLNRRSTIGVQAKVSAGTSHKRFCLFCILLGQRAGLWTALRIQPPCFFPAFIAWYATFK